MGRPPKCNPCCDTIIDNDCIFEPTSNVFNISWSTYYEGTLLGNPWVLSNNNKTIRYNVERSPNCGGSNSNIQSGKATACIITGPNNVIMNINYDGLVEQQDAGFEVINITLDGTQVARGSSVNLNLGCTMGPPTKIPANILPITLIANRVYKLLIDFSTVDSQYHVNAYWQVDLSFTSG